MKLIRITFGNFLSKLLVINSRIYEYTNVNVDSKCSLARDKSKRESLETAIAIRNRITRVITILISRGMIARDVNARPTRILELYLAAATSVYSRGRKLGCGTESKPPVATSRRRRRDEPNQNSRE